MFNLIIESLGIDGSILHSLTEDDLKDELGVSSKIMIKKMMACNHLLNYQGLKLDLIILMNI